MTCSINNYRILKVPAGCLNDHVLALECKSPYEKRLYSIELTQRLKTSDVIINVDAYPSDHSIIIDPIQSSGSAFECLIGGGTLNTQFGIRFVITTKSGETLEFVCVLPIMAQGVLSNSLCQNVVLGATGPAGERGQPGEKGEPGKDGTDGKDGEKGQDGASYINDGSVDLDVNSINKEALIGSDGTTTIGDLLPVVIHTTPNNVLNALTDAAPNHDISLLKNVVLYLDAQLEQDKQLCDFSALASYTAKTTIFVSGAETAPSTLEGLGVILYLCGISPLDGQFLLGDDNKQYPVNTLMIQLGIGSVMNLTCATTNSIFNNGSCTWYTDYAGNIGNADLRVNTLTLSDKSKIKKATNLLIGAQAFDLTSKKPCWWNGKGWVDAMGNILN